MAELPRGAVTFLFTDIEGSTQLVRRLRDRYGEVLTEHQRLLREAFAAHGGHEIDTQGDSFFYAFSSAREAVQAAIEGQRALSGYPWPTGGEVKVRMGVHTGQAAPVDGRYTGLAVHRAARIQAAAHGGQVLLSQATQSLLEDEEEDLAVGLRDLGEQRLKDIERPVRVYQVAAPGLEQEFPPLRREEEPPAAAPERRPWRSPRLLIIAGVVAVLLIVPVVALLATRSGGGGLSGVGVNHVGIIDPASGDIVAEVEVGARPGPVTVGGNTVWVGNQDEKTLASIDAKTREKGPAITLENRTPTGIAVEGDAVWVANGEYPGGSLQRVDPQFGRITETVDDAHAEAVTTGGGVLWAAQDSIVAKINPGAARVAGTTFAGSGPNGVAFGGGALWVSNAGDASVWRFNPSTFDSGPVTDPLRVGRRPTAIAFGEGAVWTANAGDANVSRIDPASNALTTIPVGHGRPAGIAVGEGFVWVANGDGGSVSKIDPATNSVVDTIETGNYAAGVAVGAGFVWVTVQEA